MGGVSGVGGKDGVVWRGWCGRCGLGKAFSTYLLFDLDLPIFLQDLSLTLLSPMKLSGESQARQRSG